MQSVPPTALARLRKLHASVVRVIRGKSEIVDLVMVALLARGHVLLEDVPGVGKTTLAQALARSVDLLFHRIQFTSDTLPSDLIGVSVYRREQEVFEFIKGPLFANVVLADEINRATPRTQSALLEAMSERSVTVESRSYDLPAPFLVIATQNPIEATGTYELPESQMDRFLMRLSMGYPGLEEELELLASGGVEPQMDGLSPVLSGHEVRDLQGLVGQVHVDDALRSYLLEIVRKTRSDESLLLGVSTRGSLAWQSCARALSLLRGRAFVTPDDLQDTARAVLSHRIVLADHLGVGEMDRSTREQGVISRILSSVPVPR